MNNGYLGMVRQWQELFWDKRYSHVDMGSFPDFVKLAEAYGAHRHAPDRQEHARRGHARGARDRRARSSSTCASPREENVYPMIPPGAGRAGHGGVSVMGEPGTKELLSLEELEAAGGPAHGAQARPVDPRREQAGRPDAHRRPVRAARLQHRHAHGRPDRRRAHVAHHADRRRRDAPDRPGHQAAAQAGQRPEDPRPRAERHGRARARAVQGRRRRRRSAARSCRSARSSAARSST